MSEVEAFSSGHSDTPVRSQIVSDIVGHRLGSSVLVEGYSEAAKRLSHALAELAASLDTLRASSEGEACALFSDKAKAVLKNWGVA